MSMNKDLSINMRYYSISCNALKCVLPIRTMLNRTTPPHKNTLKSLISSLYFLGQGTEKVAGRVQKKSQGGYRKGRREGTEKVAGRVQKRSQGAYKKGRREGTEKVAGSIQERSQRGHRKGRIEGTEKVAGRVQKRSHRGYRKGRREHTRKVIVKWLV